MSTSRQRCGSWLAWAVALAAGCADGGEGGEAKGGDGADAGADTAAVDCAAAPLDCDGEDNDCDGVADEGGELEARQLWGIDADADGYPAAAPRFACAGEPGERAVTEAEALDCDDARSEAHPGAVEDCDAAGDEDCDALADCADRDCPRSDCPELCDDGLDNDRDRRADCADRDCWGAGCAEDCAQYGDEDANGVHGCADPVCWGPACAEDCRTVGDEDADGLADCEDAECVELCVEDCEDETDNDLDGLTDCADVDCSLQALCWQDLDLRTPGPIGARVWHRESTYGRRGYSMAWELSVRIPTATFSGRVDLGGGSSAWCRVQAYGVEIGSHHDYGASPAGNVFDHSSQWVRGAGYGEAAPGCPSAAEVRPLALPWRVPSGGRSTGELREISTHHRRYAWTLADLTWGPPAVTTGRISFSSSSTRWWQETSWLGQAAGFTPVP